MPSLPEGKFLWGVTLELEAGWALEQQSLPADSYSVQDPFALDGAGNGRFVSLDTVATRYLSFRVF